MRDRHGNTVHLVHLDGVTWLHAKGPTGASLGGYDGRRAKCAGLYPVRLTAEGLLDLSGVAEAGVDVTTLAEAA
jgi:hypothetical protein